MLHEMEVIQRKNHYLCNDYYQRYYKTNEEYEKIIGIITAPGHRERLCPEPSYPKHLFSRPDGSSIQWKSVSLSVARHLPS